MKRLLSRTLLPALVLGLAMTTGCTGLWPEAPESPRKIDFGPAKDYPSEPAFGAQVRLARVGAPSWLQEEEIHYRRMGNDPHLLESYGRHVWLAPPGELLAERVDDMIDARSVDHGGETARLELRLRRFEQVIDEDEDAYVIASFKAVLEHGGERRSRVFSERLETSADIRGARTGLPELAEELVRELGDWLAEET